MQPRQSCVYSGVDEFRVVPPPDMEEEVGGKPTHARISSPPTGGVCVNHCQPGRSSDYDGEIHCAKKTRQARWRCRGEEVVVHQQEDRWTGPDAASGLHREGGQRSAKISNLPLFCFPSLTASMGDLQRRRLRLQAPPQAVRGGGPGSAGSRGPRGGSETARPRSAQALCLHDVGDRYRREQAQWERLSSDLLHPITAAASTPEPPPPRKDVQQAVVDDLLSQVQDRRGKKPGIGRALTKPGFYVLQVEAQEAVIGKLAEARAYVESLCREKEGSYRSGQALRLLRLRYQTD
ncbi:hypothetical protein BHM03_00013676 [Ensete ventricosum]|nr:hypothetical protein BHM03_00013676 [Ensete ventricosum]